MTQSMLQQGDHYFRTGKLDLAKQAYQSVLKQQPQSAFAYLGLGKIALQLAEYDRAITLVSEACQLPPNPQEALLVLSECFNLVSSPEDALTTLNFALQQDPASKVVLSALIQQHIRMGSLALAERLIDQQINDKDVLFAAYGWLEKVRIWQTPLSEGQLQRLQQLTAQASGKAKMLLNYALGQAYDRLGHYALAADHLIEANAFQLSLCDFNTQELAAFFASIKQQFPAELPLSELPQSKYSSITPIFIVGMPRTGSTLLEQMLAQHSQVDTVGEQTYFSDVCVPILENASKSRFPNCLRGCQQEIKDKVATHYLSFLSKHTSAQYVINKLPANVQNIGLIFSLFANAKIIIMGRDPRDVALSVFKNYFAQNEPYFCDLDQFTQFSHYTEKLVDHWSSVYGERLLTVAYEDLVKIPEQILPQALNYLNLAMEKRCLEQQDSTKTVDTLSAIEVRKPISNASIGGWRNYTGILFDESAQ